MKSKNYSKSVIGLMGLLLAGLVAGCGSGGDGGGGTTAQPGTLSVSMTDAPACGYDEVNVTVSKVRVHQSSSVDDPNAAGWTDITLNPPRTINLLSLNDPTQPNFALDNLGETLLGPGHYTQLRLVLAPNQNSVVLSDTKAVKPLVTPSGVQSGIKLIHEFDVESGQRVDLLLDFDACKSIVITGNGKYILKPVIKVIPIVLNGIEGFVATSLFVNQANVNNVIVSAQMNGEIVRATVPNTVTGRFFLARLPAPANYDVVITARNSPTDTCCATAVIAGVPVPSSTSITIISTSASTGGTPFTLQPSAFHAIAGTVSLIIPPPPFPQPSVDDRDDATVVVTAKQSLSGGPTVSVRSQVATLKDDTATIIGDYNYELVLPIAAPSSASYGALPITPSSSGQTGGVYTVYGSGQTPTTVYATQDPPPSSVNISGVSATQDFTLAPLMK